MALDFRLRGPDDTFPDHDVVPIGVDAHWELMQLAEKHSKPFLLRLKEYYADALFEHRELEALLHEIRAMQTETFRDRRLPTFLDDLGRMIEIAKQNGLDIAAYAD